MRSAGKNRRDEILSRMRFGHTRINSTKEYKIGKHDLAKIKMQFIAY